MAKRTVTTPSGEVWQVRRLWAPRLKGERLWTRLRRRVRGVGRRTGQVADVPDPGCASDLLDDIAIVAIVVLVVLFVVFVGIPLLVALFDLLLVALLTLLGIVARVVFRRPWIVEATGSGPARHTWRIRGWRASSEAVEHIADSLAHGHAPPSGDEMSNRPGTSPPGG